MLSEILANRRTIAAFTLEKSFMKRYEESLSASLRRGIRKANLAGAAFGCSQAVQYWVYALGFWYGGKLVASMEWRLSQSELQVTCQGEPRAESAPPDPACPRARRELAVCRLFSVRGCAQHELRLRADDAGEPSSCERHFSPPCRPSGASSLHAWDSVKL